LDPHPDPSSHPNHPALWTILHGVFFFDDLLRHGSGRWCWACDGIPFIIVLLILVIIILTLDSLSYFRLKLILSKVVRKRISAWLPLSMRILMTSHLSIWRVTTMASVWGNEARFTSWDEKVTGYDVIDLHVVITTLSLGVKISIGASNNCEDCVMGGENINLWRRFLDLRWRWWCWVGFGFDMRVGVV
jgi:hypothetical protein